MSNSRAAFRQAIAAELRKMAPPSSLAGGVAFGSDRASSAWIGSLLVLRERRREGRTCRHRSAPLQHLTQRFLESDHPCEQVLIRLSGGWSWSID